MELILLSHRKKRGESLVELRHHIPSLDLLRTFARSRPVSFSSFQVFTLLNWYNLLLERYWDIHYEWPKISWYGTWRRKYPVCLSEMLPIMHPKLILNIEMQIWIYSNSHTNTRQADWPARWWVKVYESREWGVRVDSWPAPGGEPHTKSQLNTKGVGPGNESTGSKDEDAEAQKLGRGITKESEGKCKQIYPCV